MASFPTVPRHQSASRRFTLVLLAIVALVGLGTSLSVHLGSTITNQPTFYRIPVSLWAILYYQTVFLLSCGLLTGYHLGLSGKWLISIGALACCTFSLWLHYRDYLNGVAISPLTISSLTCTILATLGWFTFLAKDHGR